jgi:uncharacterized integral membrane protein
MPYGGPTQTTQIIGRVLCLASYGLSFLVSMGDLFAPSATLQLLTPRGWTVATALTLAVLSIVGIIAVLSRRWRIEWVAATAIAFLLLERSVPVWGRVLGGYSEATSAAAMMTLGAFCLGQRALSLWIFAIKTRQTAETARESG